MPKKKHAPRTNTVNDDATFAEMSAELKKIEAFPMEKVVLSAFTGIAVLLLVITGVMAYRNIAKIKREQSTTGEVVEVIARTEYAEDSYEVVGEYYFPVVEFVVNDRRYEVEISEGSDTPDYTVGDVVTILYEPENPRDARIQWWGSSALMWVGPVLTGVIGLGFLVAVIAVWRVMGKEAQR